MLRGAEHVLGGALGERGEAAKLVHEGIGRGLEPAVRDAGGRDAPFERFPAREPARTHDHVLGACDPDHVQEPYRAARSGDHADALLREPDDGGLGHDPEVARERQLEGDPEAVAADGRDDRLAAALRRGHVAGQLGDVLRAPLEEPRDLAAAREVLPLRPEDHDPHVRVPVQLLEHQADLLALRHPHDVEGRAGEHHVRPLALRVDLHPEAVQLLDEARDRAPKSSLHPSSPAARPILSRPPIAVRAPAPCSGLRLPPRPAHPPSEARPLCRSIRAGAGRRRRLETFEPDEAPG